ncbi:MAG: uroporphyrinogen-III C-methyltransferase [Clostridiales bacterium]|nr:uroporphyrinogen-III C-methyltransferase [Clostridiales bacterium]MCF8021928.1 uroporphyrinogen-III C-methyltransferase [Clostridiales bacterium]
MNNSKVFLIGAGPGDPGLITVKGADCIEYADTIIYDRLVSPQLLKKAGKNAEFIFAGKGPDHHALKQAEINRILVEKAQEGKTVARLKGGDPFVFGRGGEEAQALAENNIPFEIIPGVTSAIAAPAYAGIPVTHREFNSNLSIITGNEDPDKQDSAIKWEHIAPGSGTLIFLMGMANLPNIAHKLIKHGRDPFTPAALIRWGTYSKQETLTGNLENIAQLAEQKEFKNPSVIVVGDVVNLREKLMWFEKKPLFNKKIIVTRTREQASMLSKKLSWLGAEPVELPTIKIIPPEDFTPLDKAIEKIHYFKWIIFTSVNGVKIFMQRFYHLNKDVRDLKDIKICAIGPATGKLLNAYGLKVDFVPSEFKAEQIIEGLKNKLYPGIEILLPRADIARNILPESLKESGANVTEIAAYKTITESSNTGAISKMLENNEIDIITFTSSSTVRNFATMFNNKRLQELLQGVHIACIGPITANTAIELGLDVSIQASEYTIDGLVEEIITTLNKNML